MTKAAATLQTVNTPAVLVDLDIARRNIDRFQTYANAHGLKVRPHIKTHKLPAVAEMQLRAGAVGITCQKVSEAEAMVAGSPEIRDVLITYNILGPEKLEHLASLARKVTLSVVADNETVIDSLSEAAIQRTIARLAGRATVIIVAHRLSTIRSAGHVLVLHDGHLVEQGTPAELLERNGRFAELYDRRSGLESPRQARDVLEPASAPRGA